MKRLFVFLCLLTLLLPVGCVSTNSNNVADVAMDTQEVAEVSSEPSEVPLKDRQKNVGNTFRDTMLNAEFWSIAQIFTIW
jgi:uncharacterized protein YcfL